MKSKKHPLPPAPKRDADTLLRALAICCVIAIHFLSSYKKSPYVAGAEQQILAVTLDQLGRVAVPLFIALSGYGLFQKYKQASFQIKEFAAKRLFQLVPLYVVWSYVYWFIFLVIPEWRPTSELKPFFGQLLYGNADYHLYFVPMIFQLYLLFPLILYLFKKFPRFILIGAAIFQVWLYWFISVRIEPVPGTTFFQSDQKQYQWAFTWLFYFILGMSLGRILDKMKAQWLLVIITYLGTLIAGYWVVNSALTAINTGTDPLIALRFTRLPVFLYATFAIVALFDIARRVQHVPKLLLWLGQQSYVIYLAHTLVLRIIFTYLNRLP